ncbi:MAG: helix-turn-helix domain-containing protein, partial [Pseudomonadota bacterium]
LFASICSPDLNTALRRIQQYKPLIGPMEMALEVGRASTRMSISCYGNTVKLPRALELSELVFFTQLSRLTTRHRICPTRIVVSELPNNLRAYRDYFGCDLRRGRITQLSFAAEDAKRPFLTANAAMWDYFEAGLNKRLALVGADSSTTERLRAVLVELLPAGISSIEHAADKMAVSKRTLQRKLTAESATYHDVLQSVREELADHYLSRSGLPLGEIAFLLGYSETNSFIRAFSAWKGVAPGNYRESLH